MGRRRQKLQDQLWIFWTHIEFFEHLNTDWTNWISEHGLNGWHGFTRIGTCNSHPASSIKYPVSSIQYHVPINFLSSSPSPILSVSRCGRYRRNIPWDQKAAIHVHLRPGENRKNGDWNRELTVDLPRSQTGLCCPYIVWKDGVPRYTHNRRDLLRRMFF